MDNSEQKWMMIAKDSFRNYHNLPRDSRNYMHSIERDTTRSRKRNEDFAIGEWQRVHLKTGHLKLNRGMYMNQTLSGREKAKVDYDLY